MVKKHRYRTAHEMTIINLGKTLTQEYPGDEIWINSEFRHEKRSVPGTNIYPDALNFSKQVAYEVHWAGNRKESQFDEYPKGWRGVNVFIVDIWQKKDVYIFALDKEHVHITDKDWG